MGSPGQKWIQCQLIIHLSFPATGLLGEIEWHRSCAYELCDPAIQRRVRKGFSQQSCGGESALKVFASDHILFKVWSSLSRLGEGTLEEMEDGFHLSPLALAKATQMILNLVSVNFG